MNTSFSYVIENINNIAKTIYIFYRGRIGTFGMLN